MGKHQGRERIHSAGNARLRLASLTIVRLSIHPSVCRALLRNRSRHLQGVIASHHFVDWPSPRFHRVSPIRRSSRFKGIETQSIGHDDLSKICNSSKLRFSIPTSGLSAHVGLACAMVAVARRTQSVDIDDALMGWVSAMDKPSAAWRWLQKSNAAGCNIHGKAGSIEWATSTWGD